MAFSEQWDECVQNGIEKYSHEVWFGWQCIERLCQTKKILCNNTAVQRKLRQEHLEEHKHWMRAKSLLVRLTTGICKTKTGEVMVDTLLNVCGVGKMLFLGNQET